LSADVSLVESFLGRHPSDAADILSELPPASATRVLVRADPADAADVLSLMSPDRAAECVSMMPAGSVARVLENAPPRIAATLLRHARAPFLKSVLEAMTYMKRSRIEAQLRYPPLSVGESMDTEFPAVRSHGSLGRLRHAMKESGWVHAPYVYVVDEHSSLAGVVGLGGLDAPDDTPVRNVMISPVESLYAFTRLDSVRDHPAWAKHDRLPVTSTGNVLVGTLRHRDLRRRPRRTEEGSGFPMADALMTVSELYWEGLWKAIDGFAGGGEPPGPDAAEEEGP